LLVAITLYLFWEKHRQYYWHHIISKKNRNNEVAYFKDSKLTSSPDVKIINDDTLQVKRVNFYDKLIIDENSLSNNPIPYSICCLDDQRRLIFNKSVLCNNGTITCDSININELKLMNTSESLHFDRKDVAFLTLNILTGVISSVLLNKSHYRSNENNVLTMIDDKLHLLPPIGNVSVDDPDILINDEPHLIQFDKVTSKLKVEYLEVTKIQPSHTLGVDDSGTIVLYESLNQRNLNRILPPIRNVAETNFLSCDTNNSLTWCPISDLTKDIDYLLSNLKNSSSQSKNLVLFDRVNRKFELLENPSPGVKYFLQTFKGKFVWQTVVHYDDTADFSDGKIGLIDLHTKNISRSSRSISLTGGNPGDVLTLLSDGSLGLRPLSQQLAIHNLQLNIQQCNPSDVVLLTVKAGNAELICVEEVTNVDFLIGITSNNSLTRIKHQQTDDLWADVLNNQSRNSALIFYNGKTKKFEIGWSLSDTFHMQPPLHHYLGIDSDKKLGWVGIKSLIAEEVDSRMNMNNTRKTGLPLVLYDEDVKTFVIHDIYQIPPLPGVKSDFLLCIRNNVMHWLNTGKYLNDYFDNLTHVLTIPSHLLCIENNIYSKIPVKKTTTVSKQSFLITFNEGNKHLEFIEMSQTGKNSILSLDDTMKIHWVDSDTLFHTQFLHFLEPFRGFLSKRKTKSTNKSNVLIIDNNDNQIKELETPSNNEFGLIGWKKSKITQFPIEQITSSSNNPLSSVLGLTNQQDLCADNSILQKNYMLSNLHKSKSNLVRSLITYNEVTDRLQVHSEYQVPDVPDNSSALIFNPLSKSLEWKTLIPDNLTEITDTATPFAIPNDTSILTFNKKEKKKKWVGVAEVGLSPILTSDTISNMLVLSKEDLEMDVYTDTIKNNFKANVMISFHGFCSTQDKNQVLKLSCIVNTQTLSMLFSFNENCLNKMQISGVQHFKVNPSTDVDVNIRIQVLQDEDTIIFNNYENFYNFKEDAKFKISTLLY
jgi:hypothetical protein